MTKKLEDFFNLSQTPPVETDTSPVIEQVYDTEHLITTDKVYVGLTTAERVDHALPTVVGLDSHDREMDDIAKKAERVFDDLISLGGNVPDMHAGKIFEVAGQMLRTALDARTSKADKKLKMIELQLKKVRAEQIDFELGNGNTINASGGEFDRNELLKYITSSKKSENSDK